MVKRVFEDISGLLRCYMHFVVPILEYRSLMCESAAECHLQLLERKVYSVARLCLIRISFRFVSSTSVFHGAGACEVAKAIYKQFVFPTSACAAGYNNNSFKKMSQIWRWMRLYFLETTPCLPSNR